MGEIRCRCRIPVAPSSESGGNSRRYRGPHLAHVTRDGRRERHHGAGIEEQLHPQPNVSKGPGRAPVPRPSAGGIIAGIAENAQVSGWRAARSGSQLEESTSRRPFRFRRTWRHLPPSMSPRMTPGIHLGVRCASRVTRPTRWRARARPRTSTMTSPSTLRGRRPRFRRRQSRATARTARSIATPFGERAPRA